MGRAYIEPEVFESGRALLEVVSAEDFAGEVKKGPETGKKFEKVNLELEVISYEEQDDDGGKWIGETFSDGAYYKANKAGQFGVPPTGKLPEYIKAIEGEEHFAAIKSGRVTFEPESLVGGRLRATVDKNDGGYSVVLWNTIYPATKKKKKAQQAHKELEEQTARDMEAAEARAENKEVEEPPAWPMTDKPKANKSDAA
jgi:hypothetical protein